MRQTREASGWNSADPIPSTADAASSSPNELASPSIRTPTATTAIEIASM
nr:hypothetical protein [Paracoccus sediminilitoris]